MRPLMCTKPSVARSAVMRAIRSTGTGPELAVQALARGLRMRRNVRSLPGSPDLASASRGLAVFVHGCFWHRHECPERPRRRLPRTNRAFWRRKFARNVDRDRRAIVALRRAGWRVLVVWECELRRDPDKVRKRLRRAADGPRR